MASKASDTRINKLLEGLGYPRLRPLHIHNIRKGHKPPRVFRLGVNHKASDRWLQEMKIYPLVYRDEHMDEATMLLSNNQIRPLLEALILGDVRINETIRLVKKRTGRKLSEQTVRYYRHFFWNRDLMDVKQWEEFLNEYPRGQYLQGIYEEGPEMVKWRLGFGKKVDANDMLKAIQGEAFHRFMQTHLMNNNSKTARVAATWAGIVIETERQLSSGDTQLTDVISRFEDIVMERSPEQVPALDDLAGNLHSKRAPQQLPAVIEVEVEKSDD